MNKSLKMSIKEPDYMNDLSKSPLQGYSTLTLADGHLAGCSKQILIAMLVPVPLVAAGIAGFFQYEPHWYKDLFLCAIMALFAFGQVSAVSQLLTLGRGAAKARKVLAVVREAGDKPDLSALQEKLMNKELSCHIRDTLLRWIQLGIQGETDGMERLMEHSALRREESSSRMLKLHININRTTLKFGFLGTLIGLMMTFEPMKQAMMSLQGSQGEFKFITDLVAAIDADAYAIVTTLFATGLSIFIELLTVQLLERILGRFEMVNNNLDDWCLIHLQPWIKEKYTRTNAELDPLFELQKVFAERMSTAADSMKKQIKEFSEGIMSIQKKMDDQLHSMAERIMTVQETIDTQIKALATSVAETGKEIAALVPIQENIGNKINELTETERQYRAFVKTKLHSIIDISDSSADRNQK